MTLFQARISVAAGIFIVCFLLSSFSLCKPGTKDAPIPDSYFGMHVHTRGDFERAFTETPFKVFRTWDSSVGWPQIEPEKDRWDWELLDRYAELARENDKYILLTLGMTPLWAARNPDAPSPYNGCSSSAPANMDDWKDFVRKVAERNREKYGGVIRYWEIWNEPDNIHGSYSFYTGTAGELAELGRAAAETIKENCPESMIVSPGITQAGGVFLDEFLEAGGKDYVDIIAFHFYWDWHSPKISDLETTFLSIERVMEQNGVQDLSMWVTETGFSTSHYSTTGERRSALVSTVLFPWYFGADASLTYSWNNTMFTSLYSDEKQEFTETHTAYRELYKWLLGSVVKGFVFEKGKIRMFTLERNGTVAGLAWRAGGRGKFSVPCEWGDTAYLMDGTRRAIPENRTIPLGSSPLLITAEQFFKE